MAARNQREVICLKCKHTFYVKASYAKRAKYCSKTCSSSSARGAYKEKIKIQCITCKKISQRLPCFKNIKFCSAKCRGAARRATLVVKNCKQCSSQFSSNPIKNRSYCNRKCFIEALKLDGAANIQMKNTNIDKYGTAFVSQIETFKQKKHCTMKTNKTYGRSLIEDFLFNLLVQCYENVERQVRINGWNIDFLINDKNVYVQLDGIYWHGLNRPIEMIQKSQCERDQYILKVIEKDKSQNEWFKENNIHLVRLTDIDVKNIKEPKHLQQLIESASI